MSNIILVVVLILVAFVIALFNNKKRREVTSERIRIVRGSMDAFDEEAWAWPEDAGEVIELHPLDTFLDGTVQLTMVKPHTLKLTSTRPFVIEGRPTRTFELANYENLVLEPLDGEEGEPIILSYEKMFNINAPVEDRKVVVARQLKELREQGMRDRGELPQEESVIAAELAAASEELDALGDRAEDALDNLGDAIEDKFDGLKDKLEAKFDGIEERFDNLKDRIEDTFDGDDDDIDDVDDIDDDDIVDGAPVAK